MGNLQSFGTFRAAHLANPVDLFRQAPISPRSSLNQVSSILGARDQILLRPMLQSSGMVLQPLFQPQASLGSGQWISPKYQQLQQIMVDSGIKEWQAGVRESGGSNVGARINQYAANSKFGTGYEWCGFFTAWNYSQAGFKYPENFASYQKSRDFFLYRSYTSRSANLHQQLDQLRQQHQSSGSSRQYMIMKESPTFDYVKDHRQYYGHVNLDQMTYNWQNIPIQAGDVALFSHGHVAMVISYDTRSGRLETVEGNTSGTGPDGKLRHQAVVRKSYDLSKAADRQKFDGFGRAALSDSIA
jgi:hypothetical protein